MKINNIDVEKAAEFVAEVQKDKSKAYKSKKVEGEWNFNAGKPQFSALLPHGEQTTRVEADGPQFMGGSATKPDPVQYCLFGLAACYAQTFASIAAERGIILEKLKVSAENKVNLTKALGIGNDPIVESAKLTVELKSNTDKKIIQEIKQLARERCPGVYCLTNPITLDIEIKA